MTPNFIMIPETRGHNLIVDVSDISFIDRDEDDSKTIIFIKSNPNISIFTPLRPEEIFGRIGLMSHKPTTSAPTYYF